MAGVDYWKAALERAEDWVHKARGKLDRVKWFLQRHWKRFRHGHKHRRELKHDLREARDGLAHAIKEGHDADDPVVIAWKKRIQTLRHRLSVNHNGLKKVRHQIADLQKVRKNRLQNYRNALKRRNTCRRELKKALDAAQQPASNFTTLDGRPCPKWIAGWLLKARANGWGGYLVSGYRTPEYSEQLCFSMCGHPSCPGMCAGRSSNHCCPPTYKGVYHEGAADLSDYWNARAILARLGAPLHNSLPNDPVHVSYTGN